MLSNCVMKPTISMALFALFLAVTSCGDDNLETEQPAVGERLERIEGYLTYQDGVGYLAYKTRTSEDTAPVSNNTTICEDLPDSLRKSTKVLFDGELINRAEGNSVSCIKNFVATDLCKNPHLSIGFDRELHPICVKSLGDDNKNVSDKLISSAGELANELELLNKELGSPVDFSDHDVIFFRQGVQPEGWDIDVAFSCDELNKKCTFRHTIRDWSHTKVGGGLNFFYAIPKIPAGYSFKLDKREVQMN